MSEKKDLLLKKKSKLVLTILRGIVPDPKYVENFIFRLVL